MLGSGQADSAGLRLRVSYNHLVRSRRLRCFHFDVARGVGFGDIGMRIS